MAHFHLTPVLVKFDHGSDRIGRRRLRGGPSGSTGAPRWVLPASVGKDNGQDVGNEVSSDRNYFVETSGGCVHRILKTSHRNQEPAHIDVKLEDRSPDIGGHLAESGTEPCDDHLHILLAGLNSIPIKREQRFQFQQVWMLEVEATHGHAFHYSELCPGQRDQDIPSETDDASRRGARAHVAGD